MTMPVCSEMGCIPSGSFGAIQLLDGLDSKLPHIDEMARNCGSRGHHRADQMRPRVPALAPIKVTIRGAGAAFMRREHVGIHANAHTAAGIPPFESGVDEDFVQAFLLGLILDS